MARGGVMQLNGSQINTTKDMESFLSWWRSERGIMTQVEVLVDLSILLFAIQVIFGWWRRCCHSAFIKYPLWLAYTMTPSVVIYTLGLMRSSPINLDCFGAWSFALLMALGSTNTMTAYAVEDNKQYLRHFVQQFLYVANLMPLIKADPHVKNLQELVYYFLILFALSMNFGRVFASKVAGSFTDDLSLYLADYMKHEQSTSTSYNPVTLEGYNYLVSWKSVSSDELSRFQLTSDMITVSHVYLDTSNSMRLKELSLSFALFQLLRRRFFGVACPESELPKTHDLIFQGLLFNVDDDYKATFRVIEAELAFAHDHMFTSIASFNTRLRKPIIILSVFKAVCYYSSMYASIKYHRIATATFMVFLLAVEVLQLYVYYTSDWARIRSVCQPKPSKEGIFPQLFGYWQNKIGQHSLLEDLHRRSFTSDIIGHLSQWTFTKVIQYQATFFSRGIKNPGIKGPDHIRLTDDVKLAVARTLKRSNGRLSNGASSLQQNNQYGLIWACIQESHTSTMLIWHIATQYCEIAHSCRARTGTVDQGSIRGNHNISLALSRYCAYLMAFVPELLPDHHLDTAACFHEARKDALEFLREERSLESMFRKMKNFSHQLSGEGAFAKGIQLGKQLEETGHAGRWKILADLWTEMILYIAPSDNARDHIQNLANGGEFLTHLWALLSHAGILAREEHGFNQEM
ncbi:unnamed protein product [Urochloa decumbens]|uniref:DUF4220 domain-containing protein n=1 Tax=Urochloa decumbens TaxID=240449 RepID=A0ABC8XZA4_9POAL